SDVVKAIDPASLRDAPEVPGGWSDHESAGVAVLPAKHLAWLNFGPDLGLPPHKVDDLSVPSGRDTSFLFDMGGFVLGRIVVEFSAPSGTVIDVGYAEDWSEERARPN